MSTTSIPTGSETVPPVIVDPTTPVTDELIAELGAKNPGYRFESTADQRLIITPGTGFLASGGEAELNYQVVKWNHENRHTTGHVYVVYQGNNERRKRMKRLSGHPATLV